MPVRHDEGPGAVGHRETRGDGTRRATRPRPTSFNPTIADDVYGVLSLRGSLNARNLLGGTAPAQVRAQVARHRARLG